MAYLPNVIFLLLLGMCVGLFVRNCKRILHSIRLGKPIDRSTDSKQRWKNMLRVAFGQQKMAARPVAAILHGIVYVGFVLINIELLEICIDGITGSHRSFAPYLGSFYSFLIGSFEVLAFLVLLAVILFWIRRNIIRIQRFWSAEMKGWPKRDADLILYFEMVLMLLFLSMNATDSLLQAQGYPGYIQAGFFPISDYLHPLYAGFEVEQLVMLERSFWWLHSIGIGVFLNYLYYSKHLHIILAFPNTYFANLEAKGKFGVNPQIKNEVQQMLFPETYSSTSSAVPEKFGVSDVFDLNWVQLMNAYSCTECGRCTSVCPAHLTGKKLSPRKIMMDTRDRLEEVGQNIRKHNGEFKSDQKELLHHYISTEEIWACTTCNACVDACPIEIDPLSIIMEMRQYLTMEKSEAPNELNAMMSNLENNGAPWPFSNQDRLEWIKN